MVNGELRLPLPTSSLKDNHNSPFTILNSQFKPRPIALQKVAFYLAKGHLLQPKTWPFATCWQSMGYAMDSFLFRCFPLERLSRRSFLIENGE